MCLLCSTEKLQIDHIVPVVDGGTNDIENLRVLCKSCNARRVMDDSLDVLRGLGIEKVMSLLGVSELVAKDFLSGQMTMTKTQRKKILRAFKSEEGF